MGSGDEPGRGGKIRAKRPRKMSVEHICDLRARLEVKYVRIENRRVCKC